MLEPEEQTILNVWVVVLRNILYRSFKSQNYINYNSVITKSDIDKLVSVIKLKSSGLVRIVVDRKFRSLIIVDRGEVA